MKLLALFLSVSAVSAMKGFPNEMETMKKWTYMKSIESCFGEDNMKQYMVNMKKAVAKCSQQDAPELNLPPFRNTYRFINAMLTNADEMENNKMMKLFHVMDKMEKMREYSEHSSGPWSSNYDQSSWMEKMMKKMMMKNMMEKMFDHSSSSYDSEYDSAPTMYKRLFKNDNHDSYDSYDSDFSSNFMENMMKHKMKGDDSSTYRQRMAALLSRSKRQAKGQGRKDSATTLPASLDIGDRLVEKLKHQQEEMEQKIGNMTCVLRECGILNQQNVLDVRTQKQYFQQFKFENKWLKNRIEKVMELCVDLAKSVPEEYTEEYNYSEHVNVGQVHMYMKCIKVHKVKTCMNSDIRDKIQANFGPLDQILEQTQMTEDQLFPLVMNLLHGDEMEFGF